MPAVWSVPVIVGVYGLDGVPGADGQDGTDGVGTEFVFAVTDSATLPQSQRPDNAWGFDVPLMAGGLNWHDGAPVLSETMQYLWGSQRRVQGLPADGAAVADPWRVPTIKGRYGPAGPQGIQGITGADGDDGEGLEGVYAVFSDDMLVAAQYPSNTWPYQLPASPSGPRRYRVIAVNTAGGRSSPSNEVST